MSEQDKERAKEQAAAQYRSICEMVDALNFDYDRMEELKEELESAHYDEGTDGDFSDWVKEAAENDKHAFQEASKEYLELKDAAGDCTSREDAEQRIQEDPLSVEVRGDWHSVGESTHEPVEFRILLAWGGPSVQIRGELDEYNQPSRAWIEYQDWYTGWTEYFDTDQDVLLDYCRQFYFGE